MTAANSGIILSGHFNANIFTTLRKLSKLGVEGGGCHLTILAFALKTTILLLCT